MDLPSLRRQLDESWVSPVKTKYSSYSDPTPHSPLYDEQYVSSLSSQLSLQMQQNSILLAQLDSTERNLVAAQHENSTLRAEINDIRRSHSYSADDHSSLIKKLETTTSALNSLLAEHNALWESFSSNQIELEQCRFEKSRIELKCVAFESSLHEYADRYSAKEAELAQVKKRNAETGQDGIHTIQRLNMLLDQANSDVSESRNQTTIKDREMALNRELIIRLQRDNQRLSKSQHDKMMEHEEFISQIKQLEQFNEDLNLKFVSSSMQVEDFRDQIDSLKLLLTTADKASEANTKLATKYEEDLAHFTEIKKLQEEEISALRQTVLKLQLELEAADQLESRLLTQFDNRERLLAEQHESQLEAATKRIVDTTTQLQQAREELFAEKNLHQQSSEKYSQQTAETSQLLKSQMLTSEQNTVELEKQRILLLEKVAELENKIISLEETHTMQMKIVQEGANAAVENLSNERNEMRQKLERHIFVLAAIQSVVHELTAESKDLQRQIGFLSQQQLKLAGIIRQMNTITEQNGPSITVSLLEPLKEYGSEVASVMGHLIEMVLESRRKLEKYEESSSCKQQTEADLRAKMLKLETEKSELGFQLREVARKLTFSHDEIQELQQQVIQCNLEIGANKASLSAMQLAHEEKASEMIRDNCELQAQLNRHSSDALYCRSSFDNKLAEELNKIRQSEVMIARLSKDLDTMTADRNHLQSELVTVEGRCSHFQQQFQRLHKDSAELVQRAMSEKKLHMQREANLKATIFQYQEQLTQTQRLMGTVQEHRLQLMQQQTDSVYRPKAGTMHSTSSLSAAGNTNPPPITGNTKTLSITPATQVRSIRAMTSAIESYSNPPSSTASVSAPAAPSPAARTPAAAPSPAPAPAPAPVPAPAPAPPPGSATNVNGIPHPSYSFPLLSRLNGSGSSNASTSLLEPIEVSGFYSSSEVDDDDNNNSNNDDDDDDADASGSSHGNDDDGDDDDGDGVDAES